MVHHAPLTKAGKPDRPNHGLFDAKALFKRLPGARFAKLPERLYRYRVHEQQATTVARGRQIATTITAKLRYLRRVCPGLPPAARLAVAGSARGAAYYRQFAERGHTATKHRRPSAIGEEDPGVAGREASWRSFVQGHPDHDVSAAQEEHDVSAEGLAASERDIRGLVIHGAVTRVGDVACQPVAGRPVRQAGDVVAVRYRKRSATDGADFARHVRMWLTTRCPP